MLLYATHAEHAYTSNTFQLLRPPSSGAALNYPRSSSTDAGFSNALAIDWRFDGAIGNASVQQEPAPRSRTALADSNLTLSGAH